MMLMIVSIDFSLPTGADIPFEGWYEFPILSGDLPTTVSKIQFDNPGSIGTVVRAMRVDDVVVDANFTTPGNASVLGVDG